MASTAARDDNVGRLDCSDAFRSRIPEADDSAPIEQHGAVGDMGEHARRVRSLLDFEEKARPVESDRDAPRQVLDQRQLVRPVAVPA
jgi:hypothetical protein